MLLSFASFYAIGPVAHEMAMAQCGAKKKGRFAKTAPIGLSNAGMAARRMDFRLFRCVALCFQLTNLQIKLFHNIFANALGHFLVLPNFVTRLTQAFDRFGPC